MVSNANIVRKGDIAKKSSTRAYAGHSSQLRHIFDIHNLNLTQYARSFGLYYDVVTSDGRPKNEPKIDQKIRHEAKETAKKAGEKKVKNEIPGDEIFKKRLIKAQIKQLEKKVDPENVEMPQKVSQKYVERAARLKQEVFTNEWKVEQRKKNFAKAGFNVGKKIADEVM